VKNTIKLWRKFNGKKYRLWAFNPKAEMWREAFKKQKVKCRLIEYANGYTKAVYVEEKYWKSVMKNKG